MRRAAFVSAWKNRAEAIAAFRIGAGAAPAEKAGIGLRRARIQRMAKNPFSVRLPDLDDGIDGRLAAFFKHSTGEKNVLAARDLSLISSQIVGAFRELRGKERTDRAVGGRRHTSCGVARLP